MTHYCCLCVTSLFRTTIESFCTIWTLSITSENKASKLPFTAHHLQQNPKYVKRG